METGELDHREDETSDLEVPRGKYDIGWQCGRETSIQALRASLIEKIKKINHIFFFFFLSFGVLQNPLTNHGCFGRGTQPPSGRYLWYVHISRHCRDSTIPFHLR